MFEIWVVKLGCGCFFWQKYLIPKSFQNFSFINLEPSWIREKIAHHIDQSIFEKKKKIFFSLKVNMFWSPYTEMMNLRTNLLEDSKVRYCFCWQLIVTPWMIWKESCGLFPSPKHLGSIIGWIKIICIESKNHLLVTINVEENHNIKY